MNHNDSTATRSLASAAIDAVVGTARAIARFPDAIFEAHRKSVAYEQLSRLGDRELADIGISRSDIPSVVMGTRSLRMTEEREQTDPVAEPLAA